MLVTTEHRFDAVHHLPSYRGGAEDPHGHAWKLRVTVEGPVGADGLAFDFHELDEAVRARVLEAVDQRPLNELVAVPSAENVAIWVWERLSGLPLVEVRLHEGAHGFVTYRGEDSPRSRG